ncbi:uncharacterized protein VTP21DRAFT_6130 [Calcarisporiella thermophila]|uniref:uncharacterized protein n=1 Tax=Calcarisporiella thermophila TaxID=911321 RepID=UPI003741F33C
MDSMQNQNSTLESTHVIRAVQNHYNWLQITSIACALVMMVIALFLRCKQPTIANTISLKLSLWIGLADVLSRVNFLIRVNPAAMNFIVSQVSWAPRLFSYTSHFFPMWFAFLSAAIALDLHLTVLCRRNNIGPMQRLYCPVATLAGLIINLPFAFVGNIYWDAEIHSIFNSVELAPALAVEILCFDVWMMSTILYSFAVILTVVFHALKSLSAIRKNLGSMSAETQKRERQFIYSLLRILLYPLVLVVCCPVLNFLGWVFFLHQEITHTLLVLMHAEAITSGLQVALNLLVFLLNPAVVRAISRYKIFSTCVKNQPSSEDTPEANPIV